MEDANRTFAIRQLAESEFAALTAGSVEESFEWGTAYAHSIDSSKCFASGIANFKPAGDIEKALREASEILKSRGALKMRITLSPDLMDSGAALQLEEDLYLLDFTQTKSAIYAWVKSKKPDKKPKVEIMRIKDFDTIACLFDNDGDFSLNDRLRLHNWREQSLAGYSTWMATETNIPVGRLAYFNLGVCGRLRSLYVAPPHRRRGIASALISHHVQLAREAGNVVIGVISEKDNPARFLYTGMGFTPIGEFWTFDGALC